MKSVAPRLYPWYLREIRRYRNVTQINACQEIGIGLQTVRLVEQGLMVRRKDVVAKIGRWIELYRHVLETHKVEEPK